MKVQIEESWQQRLQDEFDKPYFEKLVAVCQGVNTRKLMYFLRDTRYFMYSTPAPLKK